MLALENVYLKHCRTKTPLPSLIRPAWHPQTHCDISGAKPHACTKPAAADITPAEHTTPPHTTHPPPTADHSNGSTSQAPPTTKTTHHTQCSTHNLCGGPQPATHHQQRQRQHELLPLSMMLWRLDYCPPLVLHSFAPPPPLPHLPSTSSCPRQVRGGLARRRRCLRGRRAPRCPCGRGGRRPRHQPAPRQQP